MQVFCLFDRRLRMRVGDNCVFAFGDDFRASGAAARKVRLECVPDLGAVVADRFEIPRPGKPAPDDIRINEF
jgi:hypothetical protein